MPSSYTTSGIELIGDGEQSGSWGSTTNTNLEIIDRLTSQAGTISLSGTTHTLSLSDGTLSDGQYAVLVFGGAPSGTNTVTISPNDAKRVFIIKNDSGQDVILTQGSGGNVTVANGKSAIAYCDGAGSGAAVVNVSAGLVSGTLSAIGDLPPTDGNFIVGNGTTWVAEAGNTVLNSLGVNATAIELNTMDGITATTAELNVLDGITSSTAELNLLDGVTWTLTDYNTLTSSAAELNIMDGVTATTAELNVLDGITATTAELNIMDGVTATAAELNVMDGITGIATQAEAEAGGSSTTLMTPERTRQAIVHLLPTSTTAGPFSNVFPQYSYGGTTVLGTITNVTNAYLLFASSVASQTNPGTTTVYVQRSTDNGSTWGSATTVCTVTDTTSADGSLVVSGDITLSMVGYNAVRIVHTCTQEIYSASTAEQAVITVRAE